MKTFIALLTLALCVFTEVAVAETPRSDDAAAFPDVPSVSGVFGNPDKDVPFNVAVFRDKLPWGDDRVGDILTAYGVPYTVFDSDDIGVVALESFDKVILCSEQPDTFVTKVSTYGYWFNNYVNEGGYLLCGLAHMPGEVSVPVYYPGETTLTNWTTYNSVVIEDPGHSVFNDPYALTTANFNGWNSTTHGELTLSSGATLLTHEGATTIALAERSYGFGYVMATTLTFEYFGADAAAAENIVLHRPLNLDVPLRVAIFRDQLPWGVPGIDQALEAHDIPYTVFSSADIGVVDISAFDKVMISNQQPEIFIHTIIANAAWFEAYAANGGVLVNGMAHYSTHMVSGDVYPGGVEFLEFAGSYDVGLPAPQHPLFTEPNAVAAADLSFSFAAHGHLGLPHAAVMAVGTVENYGAVLNEQAYGAGFIISSTVTYPLASTAFNENIALYMPRDLPEITAVEDVGNDQGRQVRLSWYRSAYDVPGSPVPVIGYEIYRRKDANKAEGWDYLTTVPAHGDLAYQAVAPTLCDSTDAGLCTSTFLVRAATTAPALYFPSQGATGYSVDNLAPAAPLNLLLAGGELSWNEAPEPDFDYFTVYGSPTGDPADGVVLGHTTGTAMTTDFSGHQYLLVTATDFAGNESPVAMADGITGLDTPAAFRLLGAAPNPFNPSTAILFELPEARTVVLTVYDASGRVVRTLLDGGTVGAGRHEAVWDGRDADGRTVSAGVYVYRIRAGADVDVGRVLMLK